MLNMNKNDKNYVLEAFDYNFIIIISQERNKRRDQFKYAKDKQQSYVVATLICIIVLKQSGKINPAIRKIGTGYFNNGNESRGEFV